jgi:hypothetical protein
LTKNGLESVLVTKPIFTALASVLAAPEAPVADDWGEPPQAARLNIRAPDTVVAEARAAHRLKVFWAAGDTADMATPLSM